MFNIIFKRSSSCGRWGGGKGKPGGHQTLSLYVIIPTENPSCKGAILRRKAYSDAWEASLLRLIAIWGTQLSWDFSKNRMG